MRKLKELFHCKLFIIIIGLWLICGAINYMIIISIPKYEIYYCIVLSLIFGSLNYFLIIIFYEKYNNMKNMNQALKYIVNKDELTGVLNRRAFDEDIGKVDGQSLRSVIFADIDNFREFNNKYGHDIGDIVLRKVSKVIQLTVGNLGNVYRYGGEEIVVVLINCDKYTAEKIAEKIRLSIYIVDNTPYPNITISLGVATYPEDGGNINQVIKKADNALLLAKQRGKNCTISNQKPE